MKKKLTIIGKGTVGALAITQYTQLSNFYIDWYYNADKSPLSVGEGSTLSLTRHLRRKLGLNSYHMKQLNSTYKVGINKTNWGFSKEPFLHSFPMGQVALHFDASKLQNFIFEKAKSEKNVRIIEDNVFDLNKLDSDYIINCTGTPDNLQNENIFHKHKYIPVNSCLVNQCKWENPTFPYTEAIARPYGWIFLIPLANRCSAGYLYNSDINNLDEVQDDLNKILKRKKLTSYKVNNINFCNYSRKNNIIDGRIAYAGNSSFFLEPLEATSINTSLKIIYGSFEIFNNIEDDTEEEEREKLYDLNYRIHKHMLDVESMICMHYLENDKYNTDFWKNAKQLSHECIFKSFESKENFSNIVKYALTKNADFNANHKNVVEERRRVRKTAEYKGPQSVATWPVQSYIQNIYGLNIVDILNKF